MSELACGGCFTMLVYNRGATNIRCPHCGRVNSTRSANQIGHLSCGHCRTTLAYPSGASTVGCPTCRCVNPVRVQQLWWLCTACTIGCSAPDGSGGES
ncbi:hypothetical protein PVAP13_6NG022700 [Panicum virgatum]|uniref:Zinc finger LSD1-type domain-containing protein n=1 Tax=Panicum virgatum TaxID=38727 RepID=A0A8T0QUC6_PANVG|nr:hypothetical protein PVAP13_6NG022700 [Panicum virgatum]